MKDRDRVQFITLEEDDKDLIVAFAINDENSGIKSLILHRTLLFEAFLDESEKGVKVSMEDDYFKREDYNTLEHIIINSNDIEIKAFFREYKLDISKVSKSEIKGMVRVLKKQNYDNRFTIDIS